MASLLRLNMNELPMPELKRPELKPLNQPAGKPPMAPVSPVLKKPERPQRCRNGFRQHDATVTLSRRLGAQLGLSIGVLDF